MSDVDFNRWATELDDAIAGLTEEIDRAVDRRQALEAARAALGGHLPLPEILVPTDTIVRATLTAPAVATPPKPKASAKPAKKAVRSKPEPAPKTAGSPTPRRSGRPRRWDYAEIGRVAQEAREKGQSMEAAVAKHTGLKNVAGLLHNVRNEGHLDSPPQRGAAADPDTPAAMPSLTEIASTVVEAVTAGRRPVQTLIDRYDCTREQANQWIKLARSAGHLPPRDEPIVHTPAPAQFVGRHSLSGAAS